MSTISSLLQGTRQKPELSAGKYLENPSEVPKYLEEEISSDLIAKLSRDPGTSNSEAINIEAERTQSLIQNGVENLKTAFKQIFSVEIKKNPLDKVFKDVSNLGSSVTKELQDFSRKLPLIYFIEQNEEGQRAAIRAEIANLNSEASTLKNQRLMNLLNNPGLSLGKINFDSMFEQDLEFNDNANKKHLVASGLSNSNLLNMTGFDEKILFDRSLKDLESDSLQLLNDFIAKDIVTRLQDLELETSSNEDLRGIHNQIFVTFKKPDTNEEFKLTFRRTYDNQAKPGDIDVKPENLEQLDKSYILQSISRGSGQVEEKETIYSLADTITSSEINRAFERGIMPNSTKLMKGISDPVIDYVLEQEVKSKPKNITT